MSTVLTPLDDLLPHPGNPKTHDLDLICASLARFGFAEPVVVDQRTGLLVSGHGRTTALRRLRDQDASTPPAGVTVDWCVPTFVGWSSADDDEALAALVALNRTTEQGGWDDGVLTVLLERLDTIGGAGLDGVGYDSDEVDQLRARLRALAPDDDVPEPARPALGVDVDVQLGDVWQIGPHRIVCGDCRDLDVWKVALDGMGPLQMVFTSPPYASQRAYAKTPGFTPITPDGYADWWEPVQAAAAASLDEAGSMFVNIRAHAEDGQRHLYVHDLVAAHVRRWGWLFVDDLCWVDTKNGVPGGWPNRFKDAWEPVFHFARAKTIRFHPFANGEKSDAVFEYSPATAKTATGSGLLGVKATDETDGIARPSNVIMVASASTGSHEAAFPVGLPAWFVNAYTDRGGTVIDPFVGSGTTVLAAAQQGRVGVGIELSPTYVDVAVRRIAAATGHTPEVTR